ncbi:MAG: sulfite exporter TauE/SafE family protein [Chitinophagaceae bacterium]|nr:sulfite exporter TauE/SafE family protein [Chitinophagaceae bacterium]
MEVAGYLLAALVGISLGLIGGGGSILTVPILVYVMGLNPVLATAYYLFIVGSTSLVGAVDNYRKGFVNIKTALFFGAFSISTVFLTRKFIMPVIPEVFFPASRFHISHAMTTMILFALLMLMASLAMINNGKENAPEHSALKKDINILKLVCYGILIGLVTGLLGAGGGFLLIPVLVLILKMPMKQAVGTSLLIIALNSLIGFTGDLGHFLINWKFLVSISLVAIAGIFIGGSFSKKINPNKLKKAFGWFVLVMGMYIILHELFFTPAVQ